jgi:hypothetical protein
MKKSKARDRRNTLGILRVDLITRKHPWRGLHIVLDYTMEGNQYSRYINPILPIRLISIIYYLPKLIYNLPKLTRSIIGKYLVSF